MKKVSVIIPCFNATKWLPKCFMSLVQQTIGIGELELIFVNDASTDDGATWAMLQEFERAFPESIIIIDLPGNRRQGGARNEALLYASGEYIAFVDADDWVELNLYECAYGRAKETNADIIQFNHNFYFEQVGVVPTKTEMANEVIVITNDDDRRKMLLSEKITYGCWNKLYRREMVMETGAKYAEHVIYEEPLFVYPLLFAGTVYVTIPDRLYVYRQNNMGTMRNDMKAYATLLQHADVQLCVWEFMKQTPYFKTFYEEIKLYFLHTYLYEILDFAKRRDMEIDFKTFEALARRAVTEVCDITATPYAGIVAKQVQLYQMIKDGLTEDGLKKYVESI